MPKLIQSYLQGTRDVPLISDTIGNCFDAAVKRWAERVGLVVRHQRARWTYAELGQRVDAFAAGLIALGLKPGDRVGVWSPNNAEWTVTQYATAKVGLILVTLNPAYRATELEYALNKAGCKALIAADAFKSNDFLAIMRSLAPETAECAPGELEAERLPALKTLIHIGDREERGFFRFSDVLSIARSLDRARLLDGGSRVQCNDPATIMFTSGTTGAPKGATLSHRAILSSAFFVGMSLGIMPDDRICIPVPLFHVFGMIGGNLLAMVHGATAVFPSESFEPGAVLEAVAAERCTVLHGVPTMFMAQLNHPDFGRYDLTSLRTGIVAGAPCPPGVLQQVVERMYMSEVSNVYAMTEAVTCMQTAANDPVELRARTVGRVSPHIEVKIVDGEGRIVPPGVEGELCIRGYSVMLGYWKDDKRTAEAIDSDGWMHTGDLATLDEDGYSRIVGRIKDMVIRGGEKIWPREIEEFLLRHPKITDAQLFGVPDGKYGEELCAWIKLKAGDGATEEEIRAFCEGQIAHYKVPRYIRFVEGFPMTASGKAQKFLMRQQMIKDLGLTVAKTG